MSERALLASAHPRLHQPEAGRTSDLAGAARPVEEACGVFAVYAPGRRWPTSTYFGLYALQHRAQEFGCIAVFKRRQRSRLHQGHGLRQPGVRFRTCWRRMPRRLAIGHNRYHHRQQQGLACPAVRVDDPAGPFAWPHQRQSGQPTELRSSLDHLAVNSPPPRFRACRLCAQEGGRMGVGWEAATSGGKASAVVPSAWQSVTPEGLFAFA